MFDIHPVRGSDPVLKKLLDGTGLPTDDLEDAERMFFLATSRGSVFGSGGFEIGSGEILLRSIAVDSHHRSRGIGKTLTLNILDRARQGGAVRAYLLGTYSAPYLESLGVVRIDRAAAPDAILRTRQAASICPASAVLMMKELAS